MRNTPEFHRDCEQRFIEHVKRLLGDERLRIDTTRGRRPVTSMIIAAEESDHGVDVKRAMSEMNRPDRDLQQRMPVGGAVYAKLSRKGFIFKKLAAELRAI